MGVLGVSVVLLDLDKVSQEDVLSVLLLSIFRVFLAEVTLELFKRVRGIV